jgi:hypothetical protein
MSSESYIFSNTLFLRHEPLSESEDFDSVCPYDKWAGRSVSYSGFRGLFKSTLNCDSTDIGDIKCYPDDERSINKKVYICKSKTALHFSCC